MLIGFGSPLIDIEANISQDFLGKYELFPNSATSYSEKIHGEIFEEILACPNAKTILGGSALNSLRVFKAFVKDKTRCVFFGAVGNDENACRLIEHCNQEGIELCLQTIPGEKTGCCGVLISEQNRSLCTYQGAASKFSLEFIEQNWALIEKASIFYFVGFVLKFCPDALENIASFSTAKQKIFSLNLSAVFICEQYVDKILKLLPYVDLLFANSDEVLAFAKAAGYSISDISSIALKIATSPKMSGGTRIVVITQGAGSVILARSEKTEFPVSQLPSEKVIDTNGAGDAFVGGFLSQFINKMPLNDCVQAGIYAASIVIQSHGCHIPK